MKYLKGLLLLLHSEKTAFTDQVRPLIPKDGSVLEVLSAHVYTVKTHIQEPKFFQARLRRF